MRTGIIRDNYMTCVFILIGAKSRISAKAFFDRRLWEIAINIFTPPNKITEPITAFLSACYRLCVCASGSWITDILMCFTLISVSCLHFGQNNGKCSSTVSSRNLIRVLLLQIGHNSQCFSLLFWRWSSSIDKSIFLFKTVTPAFSLQVSKPHKQYFAGRD